MMSQIFLVLVAAFVETAIYTGYLLLLNRKQKVAASLFMVLYTFIYLVLVRYMFGKSEMAGYMMIGVYAVSCGFGNYVSMEIDQNYNKIKRRWYKKYARRRMKK